MKEEYLHLIWQTKRLPMHRLTLTDGRKLIVRNVGWHNQQSGPDFFNGSIQLEELIWNGNIEIHIKSSDWYAHKHHLDEAYNNVILHVVHQHDKPVFAGGEEIPTLELRSMLDEHHWFSYESLIQNKNWIPCGSQIATVDPFFVFLQTEDTLISRLERKANLLEVRFQILGNNLQQLQYETLAQAFGNKVNSLPFIELTQRIPIHTIWREGKAVAPALLLGAAGFLSEIQTEEKFRLLQHEWNFYALKHKCSVMNKLSWKFKGLRPKGFPNIRIGQFANVISRMQQHFSFMDQSVASLLSFFEDPDNSQHDHPLSASFKDLLLINAVVPLLWWYGNYKSDATYRQKAIDLLEKIKSENNEIIRCWKKMDINCKSAYDSQGLLELKHEMCDQKKCLECKIGNKILGKGG